MNGRKADGKKELKSGTHIMTTGLQRSKNTGCGKGKIKLKDIQLGGGQTNNTQLPSEAWCAPASQWILNKTAEKEHF